MKNKLLFICLVTIGIGAGTYFIFASGNSIVDVEITSVDSSKGNYELSAKKGDEVKKGQVLFKYDNSSIKQEKNAADMQNKLAEEEEVALQKQIDVATQKLQNDKNAGAAEQEIQWQEEKLEMQKSNVELANQMVRMNKETANGLVTSPVDGVIEDVNKGTDGKDQGITIRIKEK